MHLKEQRLPGAYQLGRLSREQGQPNTAPGNLTWRDRHWFAAGWNDRDLELKPCME